MHTNRLKFHEHRLCRCSSQVSGSHGMGRAHCLQKKGSKAVARRSPSYQVGSGRARLVTKSEGEICDAFPGMRSTSRANGRCNALDGQCRLTIVRSENSRNGGKRGSGRRLCPMLEMETAMKGAEGEGTRRSNSGMKACEEPCICSNLRPVSLQQGSGRMKDVSSNGDGDAHARAHVNSHILWYCRGSGFRGL